ncbi:hypothetical protein ACFVFJ_41840 [Streptomyces sp. NPDC057717]|uniref:hypothetical protein n=1 Tax=Streptomyces sp. NPDC057717 TaxID=3346224 RepID=UPI0036C7761E
MWRESGLAEHCQDVIVLADGAYINTGLVVPHRNRAGRPLPRGRGSGQRRAPQGPRPRRARLARMKNYKILRDCRQRGDSRHHAVQAIACMHNLALTAGPARPRTAAQPAYPHPYATRFQAVGSAARSCERGPLTAPVARFPVRSGNQER